MIVGYEQSASARGGIGNRAEFSVRQHPGQRVRRREFPDDRVGLHPLNFCHHEDDLPFSGGGELVERGAGIPWWKVVASFSLRRLFRQSDTGRAGNEEREITPEAENGDEVKAMHPANENFGKTGRLFLKKTRRDLRSVSVCGEAQFRFRRVAPK